MCACYYAWCNMIIQSSLHDKNFQHTLDTEDSSSDDERETDKGIMVEDGKTNYMYYC